MGDQAACYTRCVELVPVFWAAVAAIGLGAAISTLRGGDDGPPPPAWQPTLLLLGCALLAAALAGGHLDGGIVDTSDFEDYCAGAAWWRGDAEVPWPRRRARLAALPSGLLSGPLGILDGLAVAGILGFTAVAAGAYLIGASLLGPVAGGSAAVVAVALAPLAVLTRHLSFYPAIAGAFSLAAGLVARAATSERWGWWWLGCLGVGLCPLVDLRGIVWGGALGGVMLAAALRHPARWWRCGVLAAVVAASWLAGALVYPENAASLEEQAWQAVHLQQLAAQQVGGGSGQLPAFDTWTVWGRTAPWSLPSGLLAVAGIADGAPARAETYAMADAQLRTWTLPLLASAALACWRLRRTPWTLLVLLGVLAPFLLAWADAVRFGRAELRQVALAAPGAAALIGVGLGALVPALPRRWWLLPLALSAALLPGAPLGPDAAWRTPVPSRQVHHISTKIAQARHHRPPRARLGGACVRALMADDARGRLESLYGDLSAPPGLPRPPRGAPGRPPPPARGSGR